MEDLGTHKTKTTKELTVGAAMDSVKDWATACHWVEHAVKHEAERLLREGGISPEAYLKAETLRAAWKRIQQG